MIDRATTDTRFAAYEPAEDVTDLDTARRMITCLRQKMVELAEEHYSEPAGYWIDLDEEHERMLQLLYDKHALGRDPDDPYWLDPPDPDEAFIDFVEGALEIEWDMAKDLTATTDTKPVIAA